MQLAQAWALPSQAACMQRPPRLTKFPKSYVRAACLLCLTTAQAQSKTSLLHLRATWRALHHFPPALLLRVAGLTLSVTAIRF